MWSRRLPRRPSAGIPPTPPKEPPIDTDSASSLIELVRQFDPTEMGSSFLAELLPRFDLTDLDPDLLDRITSSIELVFFEGEHHTTTCRTASKAHEAATFDLADHPRLAGCCRGGPWNDPARRAAESLLSLVQEAVDLGSRGSVELVHQMAAKDLQGDLLPLLRVADAIRDHALELNAQWVSVHAETHVFRAAAAVAHDPHGLLDGDLWRPDKDVTDEVEQVWTAAEHLRAEPGHLLLASPRTTGRRRTVLELVGAVGLLEDVLAPYHRNEFAAVVPSGLLPLVVAPQRWPDLERRTGPDHVRLTPEQHGDERLLETASVLVKDGFTAEAALAAAAALL